ncbi:hypothetical protein PPERSA_00668 [Pseudocohnilembus persalinus]|uniref:Uncharacterized protein n=1 Tax=Pseudocohnilembus persalinus TaxID=266149 RepID=A0A0V0QT25_PSEPJ|nr:hypothetical protein PPERSA_00668 [Pseudocohnilembus persalinus]|eukprot:KRX05367.1 hypothetical protein PPERSA_00668 [Pseudocohnilembus persalinus]
MWAQYKQNNIIEEHLKFQVFQFLTHIDYKKKQKYPKNYKFLIQMKKTQTHQKHKEKLRQIQKSINLNEQFFNTSTYSHIKNNEKKKQQEQDKHYKIQKENQILLKKLMKIEKKPGNLSYKKMNKSAIIIKKPSQLKLQQEKQQLERAYILKGFLDKLYNTKSYYDINTILQNANEQNYRSRQISKHSQRSSTLF